MPIYAYESIPRNSGDPVRQFEIRQCMDDPPLDKHPETGEPIRKVYAAFAVGGSGATGREAATRSYSHGSGCGCCGGGGTGGACGLN